MSEEKSNRLIGIDVCRIIAMLGIIGLHIIGHGGGLEASQNNQFSYVVVSAIRYTCICSVDLFALITGYLYCKKEYFKSFRILELLIVTGVYFVVIAMFFVFFVDRNIFGGVLGFAKILQQTTVQYYWYIFDYIGLFLAMPFINIFIKEISINQHKKLVILIVAFFSCIPSVLYTDIFNFNRGFSMIWLICCYIIGAYVRNNDSFLRKIHHRKLLLFILCLLIIISGNQLIEKTIGNRIDYMASYISPFVLLMALCILSFFSMVPNPHNKKICTIIASLSTAAFDVYIIHCNPFIFENIIFNRFSWIGEESFYLIPLHIIVLLISVYFVCYILASFRILLFKICHIDRLISSISNLMDKLWLD